ncbi:MAG TPA: toll/interleukin-1 receptor domain-containing protein [Thermoanaerobaculia bacterium]|nr:toll/interleukin-1 receptor domain-containing protein [Thermoanaerobaculia bacterium]
MPPRKVFVSYSHRQEDWVVDRLVPVLRAGGAEVLIDREIFGVGRSVLGQMDETQDRAEVQVLVLSPEYLASPMCRHELDRAVALDPKFEHGVVVPVLRVPTPLPDSISKPNPLYADLADDENSSAWDLVLRGLKADLGTDAPAWLTARDEVRRSLRRDQSVNLVVGRGVDWRPLVKDLRRGELADLGLVDLERPQAASRRGLIEEILAELGAPVVVPGPPEDLVTFGRALQARKTPGRIALLCFDLAARRDSYGLDLFASLRYLITEARLLTLLVQSRVPFAMLLPDGHPMSSAMGFETVFLRGRR